MRIQTLIEGWERFWTPEAELDLIKRARRLEVPDPQSSVWAIRSRVVDELVELALACEMPIRENGDGGPLRLEIDAYVEDRIFDPLQQCLDRVYEGDEVIGLNATSHGGMESLARNDARG